MVDLVKEKCVYVEDANYPGEAYRFYDKDNVSAKERARKYAAAMNEEGAAAYVTKKLSTDVEDIIDIY